jgi:hypothetical protein
MRLAEPEGRVSSGSSSEPHVCSGLGPSTAPVAQIHSAVFAGGAALTREGVLLRIYSSVTVMPSAEAAAREVDWGASATGRGCRLKFWQAVSEASPRLAYGHVNETRLPVSARGTSGACGEQVTLRAINKESGVARPRYVDDYEFAKGRADVRLSVIMTPQPFPQHTERFLVSLLAARASAHSL